MEVLERLQKAVSTEELVKWTTDVVALPSYPGVPQQERAVAEYIKALLDSEGVECWLDEVKDGRCNVIGLLRGSGGGRSLMLNGHIDTVKPDGMPHATEPYVENGSIHGRGTADMKGPVICMVATLIGLKRAGITLAGDLLFTGVIDEELVSLGTIDLIEKGYKADAAIVGEPTLLNLCIAHRGLEWYEFKFIGKAVHGGRQDEGVNAILKAVDFVNELNATLVPEIYSRKHPILKSATLNIGVIHGGTQLSTVPGECSLWVDRRFLPGEEYANVNQEFQDVLDRLGQRDPTFKCEMIPHDVVNMQEGYYHPPLETSADDPIAVTAKAVLDAVVGHPVETTLFPAWTDGALVNRFIGIPTVVVGPGDIEECHSTTEHIPIEQLNKGYLCYAQIAHRYCNQDG